MISLRTLPESDRRRDRTSCGEHLHTADTSVTGRAPRSRLLLAPAAIVFMGWLTGAHAQLLEMPTTWGGDLASRPRLTGDWGGSRDHMGKDGVEFDVDLLTTPQSVLSGGRSSGGDTWSNLDYTLQVDTDKAGFWPGGLLKVSGDTGLGTNVYANSGALVPVNTAAMFPAVNEHTTALTNATLMQFFSEKFGVVIGKINTMDTGGYEFYGDYKTQFLNAAFVFPMTLEQVPLSAFGAGIILLPGPDTNTSILVLDPNGTPTSNDIGNAFNHGSIVVGSGQVTIKPKGRVGHQNFGFSWSNKERYSLEQDPSNLATLLLQQRFPRLGNPGPMLEAILARYFPDLLVPAEPAARKSNSWSVSYGLDQYLWQPAGDEKHGIGVFLSLGASDGNPNPIKYAFLLGVGGKGVGARRDDSFGVGIARTRFSEAFVPLLRTTLALGLEHEDALEMYYNCAVAGWLTATADLQVIDLGLKKTLSTTGPGLTNMNTAVVAGIRVQVRF